MALFASMLEAKPTLGELWSLSCGAGGVEHELWSRRCGARAQRAAERAVRNAKCGTRRAEREVRNVSPKEQRPKYLIGLM